LLSGFKNANAIIHRKRIVPIQFGISSIPSIIDAAIISIINQAPNHELFFAID
jgi:hypothetical protein